MIIPYTAEELIEQLDKMFPEYTPEVDWNDREIWMYAGKRELIRMLKVWLENADEEDVKGFPGEEEKEDF